MSDTLDPTAPAGGIHAAEQPHVVRTRGPYHTHATKKTGARKGYQRKAVPRAAETRADVPLPQAPRMTRVDEGFQPDYDGPTRRPTRDDRDVNKFEPPAAVLQKLRVSGWSVEWKVITVYNQPVDGTDLLEAQNAGWRPAKAKNFPELVAAGTDPEGPVERFGQRLYIRPAEMTRQAQLDDYNRAQEVMKSRMGATQEGRSVRSDEEGLSDMGRVVRPVAIQLNVEGESGTHGVR